MILLELRESKYRKAFEIMDELNEHISSVKHLTCDLYDCLEDCYESELEDPQYEEEYPNENYANIENVEVGEINYRKGMRHDDDEYADRTNMRRSMRSSMRRDMRRKPRRMGRYSY